MVFEGEVHSAFLSLGEALLDAVDAPAETIVLGIALQDRFLATQFHQARKALHRTPTSGVQAYAGNTHLVSQLDALLCVLHIALTGLGIRGNEVLVDGEADKIHPVEKGVPLELAEIIGFLRVHLAMKNVHAFHPETSRLVDYRFDGGLRRAKVPIGIAGNPKLCLANTFGPGFCSRNVNGRTS